MLSGGVRIAHWQVTAEGRWQTTLDGVQAGKWSFAQLFVNDQRRYRHAYPSKVTTTLPSNSVARIRLRWR